MRAQASWYMRKKKIKMREREKKEGGGGTKMSYINA